MIIVQLKGGLGNQLFQYAAALSLADFCKTEVKVDTSQLSRPDEAIGTVRDFELQHLIQPPKVASLDEVKQFIKQDLSTKYFQKLLPSYQRKVYNEKQFYFDPNFFKATPPLYLKGYRQSEKYFENIAEKIRNQIVFKPELLEDILPFAESLVGKETVSIHIRRADYTSKAVANYHGVLDLAYYQEAVNKISKLIENPLFLVFSDNINWVKDNLSIDHEVQFISNNISKNHYHDFYLMSQCRHNIIANSSFSWWAAWLNPNPGKVVIAPKKWFNNAPYDTRDLIPLNWIQL